jgi:hypothetical protein
MDYLSKIATTEFEVKKPLPLDKYFKAQSCESNVIPKEFSANIITKESPRKDKSVSFYLNLMIYLYYSQQSK